MIKKVKDLRPGDRVLTEAGDVCTITACERAPWIECTTGQAYEVQYNSGHSKDGASIFSGGDTVSIEKGEHGED